MSWFDFTYSPSEFWGNNDSMFASMFCDSRAGHCCGKDNRSAHQSKDKDIRGHDSALMEEDILREELSRGPHMKTAMRENASVQERQEEHQATLRQRESSCDEQNGRAAPPSTLTDAVIDESLRISEDSTGETEAMEAEILQLDQPRHDTAMDLSPPFHREHATMSTGPPLTPPMSPKTYRTEWDEAACRREIEADEAEKAHLELSILKIGTAKAFGEDPDIVWTKRSSESQQATQNLSPTRHLGALSADEDAHGRSYWDLKDDPWGDTTGPPAAGPRPAIPPRVSRRASTPSRREINKEEIEGLKSQILMETMERVSKSRPSSAQSIMRVNANRMM